MRTNAPAAIAVAVVHNKLKKKEVCLAAWPTYTRLQKRSSFVLMLARACSPAAAGVLGCWSCFPARAVRHAGAFQPWVQVR